MNEYPVMIEKLRKMAKQAQENAIKGLSENPFLGKLKVTVEEREAGGGDTIFWVKLILDYTDVEIKLSVEETQDLILWLSEQLIPPYHDPDGLWTKSINQSFFQILEMYGPLAVLQDIECRNMVSENEIGCYDLDEISEVKELYQIIIDHDPSVLQKEGVSSLKENPVIKRKLKEKSLRGREQLKVPT